MPSSRRPHSSSIGGAELDGVRCEVGDLSICHHPAEILEPEPLILPDEGHDH